MGTEGHPGRRWNTGERGALAPCCFQEQGANAPRSPGRPWAALVFLLAAGAALPGCGQAPAPPSAAPPATEGPELVANIHQFCKECHAFPPADTFPRSAWAYEVEQAYGFYRDSDLSLRAPPFEAVVKYFEDRAPLELPPARYEQASGPPPVSFRRSGFAGPRHPRPPAVANVNLVHLFDKERLDVLACDMRHGLVMVLSPYTTVPAWRVLAEVPNPAHAEVVDLDQDGIADILVANLGSFQPTDLRKGSVVWLRGNKDGTFTPVTLFQDVGRVADVQAADFDGDGKLDLVVAAFGWNKTGEIYLLHNKTTDWNKPRFEPEVLDKRHGAIHVPVCDLNNDGKLDFVALISQQHETVIAFLGDGAGHFTQKEIWTAPHPGYGSSGIELVDLDGDGRLDVLYTNGDILDQPHLLKPYHSIQWLQNKGGFPFVHHPLTPMYGVHRAVAADVDGDGLKDIVATGFLPEEYFPQRKDLDAVILLHQDSPGHFVRHSLEKGTCDHVTCAAGDLFHTGRVDLVIGNFLSAREADSVTIWKNPLTPHR
jgi:hypothetical protein